MPTKSFAASVLAGSMLVGATGCDQKAQHQHAPVVRNVGQAAPASNARNVFDTLSQYQFVGQDGQPVNMAALRTSLQNNPSTLTFGFAECQNYCPMINNVLGKLGKVSPGLTSIVVSANPEVDGLTPDSRAAFLQRIRNDGVAQNVVILYPTVNGGLSAPSVPNIAVATGAITNSSRPLDHSAKIILSAPDGTRLAEKSGLSPASEFINEWTPLLNNGQVIPGPGR